MKIFFLKYNFIVLILFCFFTKIKAEQVYLEKGIYTDGLWCFPLYSDSLSYVYLPSNARLATDEKNNPKFSYLRYVINKSSENNTNKSITDADGGGILHFLVLYNTSQKNIQAAEENIRKKTGKKEIKLKGPMVFEKGSYALVSSILTADSSKTERRLIAKGDAPILENTSMALSFSLTPSQSKLLLESFKMKTPDISLVFDLSFFGLTESYDAELEVDWSEVKKSEAFKAGGSVYFVSADVELGFEKLRKDGAIKLKSNGNHASMEGLLTTVYDKLLTLMFQPAKEEKVENPAGMASAIGALLSSTSRMTGFGINVGYQLKEMQTIGKSRLFFKGRSTSQRHHYLTFNIGDVYAKVGKDVNYFKDVPLWDPAFQQREVFIGVDGELESEFKKMLNSVSVFMHKKHESGSETLENVVITKETFKNTKNPLVVVYGYEADTNRLKWMDYQYRSIWQFQGGVNYETTWENSSAAMINLYTPFTRKTILLDGDLKKMSENGIKAVSIKVNYDFFGKPKEHRITLRPTDNISEKIFEITLPNHIEAVDYELTWIKNDGSTQSKKGKDRYGLIFVDEML